MGPTEALVRLAETKNLSSHVDTLTATKKLMLVAIHLDQGDGTFRLLEENTQVRGSLEHKRTSNILPRPFRDDATYTLGVPAMASLKQKSPAEIAAAIAEAPKKQEAYAQEIEALCRARPRSKGLVALHHFLTRRSRCPKWLTELMDKTSPLFVPFWQGQPLFEEVVELFTQDQDQEGERRQDIVTGEWGIPTDRPAAGIHNFGTGTGVTFMSVNETTTARHGIVGTSVKRLRAPVTSYTMTMHVKGFQWLVDRRKSLRIENAGRDDNAGRIQIFFWTASGEPGIDDLFYEVLDRGLKLDELEARAADLISRKDTLCVLGAREDKRAQYVLWHCLPAAEALANLLTYARAHTRHDGIVLTLGDALRTAVPFHLCLEESGSFSFKKATDRAHAQVPPAISLALVDHVVDGQPFPQALVNKVRITYATQQDTFRRGARRHLSNQELVME